MSSIFQKKYFLNLVFGLVNFVLLVFIIVYSLNNVFKKATELAFLKKEFFLFEKEQQNLEMAREELRLRLARLAVIDNLLIEEKAPVDFIGFLEKSSAAAGFPTKINPVSFSKSKTEAFSSIAFQVSGQGDPKSFLRLLEKAENSPYLTNFVDLSLNKVKASLLGQDRAAPPNNVEANFTVKVYTK